MINKKFPWYILITIILLKFLFQYLVISSIYELHRDEFLHLDQANHLQWGYPSVPPFTSWQALIIKWLGNGLLWVRFFPALAGALTIWVVWETVKVLKGTLYAAIIAACCVLFSGLLRINILFQPNSFDILFYTLIFFFIIKYIKTEKEINLYYLGITIGFGLLNKYNIIFLLMALVVSLPFTKQRKLFVNQHFWLAMLLALFIVSPNIWWQIKNHFPVVWHMKTLARTQLENVSRIDFVLEQVKFFFGAIPFWFGGLLAIVFYKPFKPYKIVAFAYLSTILLFIYLHGKAYYAVGLYPILFAFGAIYLDQLLSSKKTAWIKPTLVIFNIALIAYFSQKIFPILSPPQIVNRSNFGGKFGTHKWEDGKEHPIEQDFADMIGWTEMANKTDSAFLKIHKTERKNLLVLTENYGQTGAINYYSKNIKNAVCYSLDYIKYFPHLNHLKHLIFIGETPYPSLIAHFKSNVKIGEINNKYAREKGAVIYLFSYPDQYIIKKLQMRLKDTQE
ncbi:glycosyltransferase family 39 protein [Pedobacter sp. SD-b]|uniref:Glycosyltransferase family 39 protein n=1 Tax=Pedobacter segetis TaxID=2793069 RepID=A0ABS1BGK9_9SPHI|nr:glycosyltransferase family 39 protein [Pedobacter segetis]MBK0382006.1 glycosyltransferase family 39 protein [Pedobacter segetis]